MPENGSNFAGFYAPTIDADGIVKGFVFGTDLDDIKRSIKKLSAPKKENGPVIDDSSKLGSENSNSDMFGTSLQRISEVCLSLNGLINSANTARYVYSGLILQLNIHLPVTNSSPIIYNKNGKKIYGLTGEQLLKIRTEHRKIKSADKGFDLFPSAIFLAMISTFDTLVSDIVRNILNSDAGRLKLSGKSLAVSEIVRMNSIEEIFAKIIDDEIYNFSRGSHEEQVQYIEKMFGVKIIDDWKRWPDFIEIFERRNLIAHGSSHFNQRYINICKSAGHKGCENLMGSKVELRTNYMRQSLDVLSEFLILAMLMIWRKIDRNQEERIFKDINRICYDFILNEVYRVPIRVIEFAVSLKGSSMDEATRRMMVVNLASCYKHIKQSEKCIETLASMDWGAVADNYRICVEALKENIDEVIRLMPIVTASNMITKLDFREWPVFDGIRSEPRFCEAFKEQFGEDLFDSSEVETSDEKLISV